MWIFFKILGLNTIAAVPVEVAEGHEQIQDVCLSVKKVPGSTVDLEIRTKIRYRDVLSRNLRSDSIVYTSQEIRCLIL